jgi:hypothetical protein
MPSGAEAHMFFLGLGGTAEAVPFPEPFMRWHVVLLITL